MAVCRVNPLTLSTVWHALQSICREMRHVVDRTSQNYLIAQLHDVSVGIWDARARTEIFGRPMLVLGLDQQTYGRHDV